MRTILSPLPGCIWLEPGDVFNFAGKRHIIDFVNGSRARGVPMESTVTTVETRFGGTVQFSKSAKSIDISPQVDRAFVIERLGSSGLKEFLQNKHNRKELIMKIEPGDVLLYSLETSAEGKNGRFTCTAVSDKAARIASVDYEPGKLITAIIPRSINDFFIKHKPRLTDHERKNELGNFLSANASATEELTKEPAGEEAQKMPKNGKAKSKGSTAPAAPKERKQSKCGFIDELFIKGGHTKSQILELTLAKFPGSTKKATMSTINVRPSHVTKAGKTPKWEEESKTETK